MTALVSPRRRCVALSLASLGLAGAALGWLGLYAVAATFARGTVWWVGAGFLASGPIALAGMLVAIREPQLKVALFVSCLALFIFVTLWMLVLAIKFA